MLTGNPSALSRGLPGNGYSSAAMASAICKRFISITISVQHAWTRRALRRCRIALFDICNVYFRAEGTR